MRIPEPRIVEIDEPMVAAGLGVITSEAGFEKDAAALASRYAEIELELGERVFDPRIRLAVSYSRDGASGDFRYAIGELVGTFVGLREEFERIAIPSGTYALFQAARAEDCEAWLRDSAWKRASAGVERYEYRESRGGQWSEAELRIPVEPR